MGIPRPIPRLNPSNRPFWTGGAEGNLNIMRCHDCGAFLHPPREICRDCLSENVGPEAMPGTAVVDSYTINHQPWAPRMDVPFVIARVAVDGAPGVFLTTNIINCPVDSVDIGDSVRVVFEQQGEIYYPLFEKVEPNG